MSQTYILWAIGADQKGIVAGVSRVLYQHKCNLEDSSMMRLGSEFGILLIFSSQKNWPVKSLERSYSSLASKLKLSIQIKKIPSHLAKFKSLSKYPTLVSIHGPDRMGIVAKVTHLLAKNSFNITDLSTHRTSGKKAGYIILIEGEMSSKRGIHKLRRDLLSLSKKLKIQVTIQPISQQIL